MGLFSWLSRKKKKETEEELAVTVASAEETAATPEEEAAPAPEAATAATPVAEAAPAPEAATAATPVAEAPAAPEAAPAATPVAEAPAAPEAAPAATPVAEAAPTEEPATEKRLVGGDPEVVVRVVRKEMPQEEEETPEAPPAEAPVFEGPRVLGKYEFDLQPDGYRFYLVANNGQLLYESVGFTSMEGALVGVDTFRRAVKGGNFSVISDKYKRYRYVLNRKYYGENYESRAQCERCVESVKRFAPDAVPVEYEPTEEKLAAYAAARAALRTVKDVDWDAVAAAEAAAAKLGKFEISREENREFRFYLVANNGQVLYTGKNYQKLCHCLAGIESFKRAVYVGNFSVDEDKFGKFRFVLRNIGVAPAFMGESYTTRQQCESSIESVKNFVVTAEIKLPED